MALSDKAMLSGLSIRVWNASKYDKAISQDVAQRHNAGVDAGRYNKALVSKDSLAKIKKTAGEARNFHYYSTLPWEDSGFRLLPAAAYWEYINEIRRLKGEYESAVRDFVAVYPNLVSAAQSRLGAMYNAAEYPDPSEIGEKFGFEHVVNPMPDADDFRVSLADGETDRIRTEIETRTTETVHSAMRDLWGRLNESVSHMAERLAAYEVTEDGIKNPFRDSLVGNVRDLVEILPRLNLTDDPDLESIRQEIASTLAGLDPQTLRTDESARAKAQESAESILEKMSGYTD